MKLFKNKIDDFFKWVKGTELIELDDIDVSEDPVRPELTIGFRITHGRKIFGLKFNDEIEAIVCVAFCPEVPYTVREMDYMSRIENGRNDGLPVYLVSYFINEKRTESMAVVTSPSGQESCMLFRSFELTYPGSET